MRSKAAELPGQTGSVARNCCPLPPEYVHTNTGFDRDQKQFEAPAGHESGDGRAPKTMNLLLLQARGDLPVRTAYSSLTTNEESFLKSEEKLASLGLTGPSLCSTLVNHY